MSEPHESDKAFLTRQQVGAQVKEVMGRLGSAQPAEPLGFAAEQLAAPDRRRADLQHALSCLQQQQHHSSAGFLFAAKEAFDTLRRMQRDSCRLHAVCGGHCTQLLELLLLDCPAGGLLLQRLRARPQAAVQFGHFYSAVLTVFVFRSYVAECASLFADAEALAAAPKGGRHVCAALLQLLDAALADGDLFARFDAVSAPSLHAAAGAARAKARLPANGLSQSEFVNEAAALFIKRVL